jgi:hypothetical protein
MLADAFCIAAGGPADDAACDDLLARAEACPLAGVAIQVHGLVARRFPARAARHARAAFPRVAEIDRRFHALRREVASVHECLDWLEIRGRNA